jgi:predicted glutamine amidotransferase
MIIFLNQRDKKKKCVFFLSQRAYCWCTRIKDDGKKNNDANKRIKKVVLMIATTRLFIQKQKCHIGPNKVNLVSKNKGTNSTN